MKKFFFAMCCIVVLGVSGYFPNNANDTKSFREVEFSYLGLSIHTDVQVLEHYDNYDKFLGDGDSYSVYNLLDSQIGRITEQIKSNHFWNKIDGPRDFKQEVNYKQKDKYAIPSQLSNGFFFYKGRTEQKYSKDQIEKVIDGEFLEGSYTFAWLDTNEKKLFIYSFDS